jgi:hypothetical protein
MTDQRTYKIIGKGTVPNQVDGLKVLAGQSCSFNTKLRAFQLADELAVLVYRVTGGFPREELCGLTSEISVLERKILETEKVLNGLIRSFRNVFRLRSSV